LQQKTVATTPEVTLGRADAEDGEPRLIQAAEIEQFYRALFLPLVRRAIRRHGLSNEDARDVVQETFVIALAKMEAEGNALAWLKKVVDFLAVNLKRTTSRRASLLAKWAPFEDRERSLSQTGSEGL
jgi:DNA-directed RNA polymerase specialized sigma24 family protein